MLKVSKSVGKVIFCLQIAAIFVALLNAGCSLYLSPVGRLINAANSHNNFDGSDSPKFADPVVKSIDSSNYMNGRTFCSRYSAITSSEKGRYVTVPADYSRPQDGVLEVYAYTLTDFDPSKPSYIYVDGGPGQNTHGMMPEYFGGAFNEIRFDQRGLGCSAPESYQKYKDPRLYSSMNNIKDMEQIRNSFGIRKWSIYGVSYGTVPATMYGSHYPDSTVSVVLEGTFGKPEQVHVASYKAEKMNLALATLSSVQRASFDRFITSDQPETTTLIAIIMTLFYQDHGMATAANYLQRIFLPDGTIDHAVIARIAQHFIDKDSQYPDPQQPGAVDENIMNIIYCKNLGYLHKMTERLGYDPTTGFNSTTSATSRYKDICDRVQVRESDEEPFVLSENKVNAAVYYFQGSHDGATQALGAMTHWKTVPQGASYFMLAQKGGHNPNLIRLESRTAEHGSTPLSLAETKLFQASVRGVPITANLINEVNANEDAIQKWVLYLSQNQDAGFLEELQGIQRILQPVF